MENKPSPYAPPLNSHSGHGNNVKAMRKLKRIFGVLAVACIVVAPMGTVFGMVRAFYALSTAASTPAPDELARSIRYSLFVTLVLLPVALISLAGWVVCWFRIRRVLRSSIRPVS
ncbi:MotA/TolQ/ExbB proton channel family protein [Neorhodopirellula lusitana]|uniref:MotA/TolQ/ExbB proton channel family protein n=1 Tax=Neorhodopirellula lusitana TaxID=445327 RepID=A0ABY1QRY5_9BACT|nr:MotA/TolQ/ExbB proton channel family protein [Neorhodopirellula lusitana]SMP79143.1 MotA/TolQ/ExbB proton channel family protein [Neorhodopirellula lusitana]